MTRFFETGTSHIGSAVLFERQVEMTDGAFTVSNYIVSCTKF